MVVFAAVGIATDLAVAEGVDHLQDAPKQSARNRHFGHLEDAVGVARAWDAPFRFAEWVEHEQGMVAGPAEKAL